MREYRLYLKDILTAMNAIEKFTEGMSFEEFARDDKTSSAVIRKLEIIGEATKNIPEYIRQKYSNIPWKRMAGMQDVLIHFYFGVDYDLLWQAIENDIPYIEPLIFQIVDDLERNI